VEKCTVVFFSTVFKKQVLNICGTTLCMVFSVFIGLGIRGTQVKSSIQDIVDEVAPIKKAPLWV
jgi:hypothetical protein